MKTSDQNRQRRRVLKRLAGGALLPLAAPALAQLPTVRPPLAELVPVLKEITQGAQVREARVEQIGRAHV